jgi:hypothetical protein
VAAVRLEGPGAAVSFIGREAAGRVRSFSGWLEWETPEFRVDSDGPVEVGIDGEAMRLDPPLVFQSRPGALRVQLPKTAKWARHSGPSASLTPATIASLLAVAAGRA